MTAYPEIILRRGEVYACEVNQQAKGPVYELLSPVFCSGWHNYG
jgi:hypothetical protein